MGVMKRLAGGQKISAGYSRIPKVSVSSQFDFDIGTAYKAFFDKNAVKNAVREGMRRKMMWFGADIRKTARRSMRVVTSIQRQREDVFAGQRKRVRAYKPSRAGQPPRAVKPNPLIRNRLFFAYDSQKRSVVAGPERIARGTGVPELHEHGGRRRLRNPRRRLRKVGDGAEIRIPGGFPIYTRIRTRAQARRANRLNRLLYGPLWKHHTYPGRPYMQPAMQTRLPVLRRELKDSITI